MTGSTGPGGISTAHLFCLLRLSRSGRRPRCEPFSGRDGWPDDDWYGTAPCRSGDE